MRSNENRSMCSECGGRCCKRFAGSYKYSELGKGYKERLGKDLVVGVDLLLNPIAIMSSMQALGIRGGEELKRITEDMEKWNILFRDSKNFSEFSFFVKPRQVGDRYNITTASAMKNLGECVNLNTTGCSLEYDKRPFGCKVLRPNYKAGVDKCTNEVQNVNLLVAKSWQREHEFLEKFVLKCIYDNMEIRKDEYYRESIVEPLIEKYGDIEIWYSKYGLEELI